MTENRLYQDEGKRRIQHVSMTYSPSASVLYAPVVTVPDAMVKDEDFWLYFIKGNISRCNG